MLWAHESLPNLNCQLGAESLKIQQGADETYQVTLPGAKSSTNFGKPKVKDFFDPKHKQLFDTYTFKKDKMSLVVRRPETKGPIKNNRATWNNKEFDCQTVAAKSTHNKKKKH